MAIRRYRRWSDNDKHLGPFITYATRHPASERWWGAVLDSGDEESSGCHVRFYLGRLTLLVDLPQLIQPYRRRVAALGWDDATVARMGRNWYFDVHEREYGFQIVDGHLSVQYGRQTDDSSTEQRWGWLLPWMQWRYVRQSWYGPAGQHIETLWETRDRAARSAQWEWRHDFEASLAKVRFEFADFDGQRIVASTHIEEREWRLGEGWFRWLSVFRRPLVRRSLSIAFSAEVGPDKGSWKGGTTGHGIEMLPGELHEAAFRRYCAQTHRAKGGAYRIAFGRALPEA